MTPLSESTLSVMEAHPDKNQVPLLIAEIRRLNRECNDLVARMEEVVLECDAEEGLGH